MTDTSACPACGEQLYHDDVFCPRCGARRGEAPAPSFSARGATRALAAVAAEGEEAPTCPGCGAPRLEGDPYCAFCGTAVELEAIPDPGQAGPAFATEARPPKPAPDQPAPSPEAPTAARDHQEEPRGDGWHEVRRQLEEATRGEFEIIRELGRGGMAAVYLGRDLALGRDVALKVMAPGLLMGPGMVDRFRQEAVTIAKLHHPNIVTIHTVGQAANLHYFVMQFVEGAALEDILERTPALPIHLVQIIIYQLGVGLSYAHRRGIVHRDIKPGNALLDAEGTAILTDFGIAKVTTATNLTQTGATIGTPAYMSPEQCRAGELSGASDQYSLGVVAYEMITGRPPFAGSPFEIMQAHTASPPPRIRDLRPDCPPEVEAAVYRMMAKSPADRFPDVAEAIEALGGYLPGPQDPIREELAHLVDPSVGRAPSDRAPFTPFPGRAPTPDPRTPPPEAGAPAPAPGESPAAGEPGRKPRIPLARIGVGASLLVAGSVGAYLLLTPEEAPQQAEPAPVTAAVESISFPSPEEEVLVGTTLAVRASLLDGEGQPVSGEAVEWSSDDPGIASVAGTDEEATLTGVAPGSTAIRARSGSAEGTLQLLVAVPGAGSLTLSAPSREVVVGSSLALSAILTEPSGEQVPDPELSWSSSDPGVLRVDPSSGAATGVALGTARVTVASGDRSRSVEMAVVGRVESVAIAPPVAPLRAGERAVLRATVSARPAGFLGPQGMIWTTSDPAVASVARSEGDSVVLALNGPGEVLLSAQAGSERSALSLTVLAAPATVTLSLAPESVAFQANVGGAAPAGQAVAVTVTGGGTPAVGTVRYAGGGQGWLTATLENATGDRATLQLRAAPGGLAEGDYQATVPVQAGPASREVEVRLTVAPAPGPGPVEPTDAAALELSALLQAYVDAIKARNSARVREIFPNLEQGALNDLMNLRPDDELYLTLRPGSLRPGPRNGTLDADVLLNLMGRDRPQQALFIYTFGRGQRGWYIDAIRPGG